MDIIRAIETLPWKNLLEEARAIFIFLDVVFFILLCFFVYRALSMRPKFKTSRSYFDKRVDLKEDKELKKRWKDIMEKSVLHPPQSYSLAIIEADTFIDTLLSRMGLEGDTMKEKLDQLDPQEITTLNTVWRVHRIRNMLVHTPGFTLKESQAREVLLGYESFLKELEII